jgi:FlaA1/EpsC-like NDP-sugar epimerase
LGQGGEVFMLDMGEPVKIVDLARDVIELSGLEVGRDIEIAFTGARPGEKLYEELFTPGESYRRTEHQKIFVIESASNNVLPSRVTRTVAHLEDAVYSNSLAGIVQALGELLPEYRTGGADDAASVMQGSVSGGAVDLSPLQTVDVPEAQEHH